MEPADAELASAPSSSAHLQPVSGEWFAVPWTASSSSSSSPVSIDSSAAQLQPVSGEWFAEGGTTFSSSSAVQQPPSPAQRQAQPSVPSPYSPSADSDGAAGPLGALTPERDSGSGDDMDLVDDGSSADDDDNTCASDTGNMHEGESSDEDLRSPHNHRGQPPGWLEAATAAVQHAPVEAWWFVDGSNHHTRVPPVAESPAESRPGKKPAHARKKGAGRPRKKPARDEDSSSPAIADTARSKRPVGRPRKPVSSLNLPGPGPGRPFKDISGLPYEERDAAIQRRKKAERAKQAKRFANAIEASGGFELYRQVQDDPNTLSSPEGRRLAKGHQRDQQIVGNAAAMLSGRQSFRAELYQQLTMGKNKSGMDERLHINPNSGKSMRKTSARKNVADHGIGERRMRLGVTRRKLGACEIDAIIEHAKQDKYMSVKSGSRNGVFALVMTLGRLYGKYCEEYIGVIDTIQRTLDAETKSVWEGLSGTDKDDEDDDGKHRQCAYDVPRQGKPSAGGLDFNLRLRKLDLGADRASTIEPSSLRVRHLREFVEVQYASGSDSPPFVPVKSS